MFSLYYCRKNIAGPTRILTSINVARPFDVWTLDPSREIPIQIEEGGTRSYSGYLIFTGGTKAPNTVGAAFCVFNNNEWIDHERYSLPPWCSTFDAERLAAAKGIHYVQLSILKIVKSDYICTDSHSVLKGLQNPFHTNGYVQDVLDLLFHMKGKCDVRFMHVRSHTDILGNELADALANKARFVGLPVVLKQTKRSLRLLVCDEVNTLWVQSWRTNDDHP